MFAVNTWRMYFLQKDLNSAPNKTSIDGVSGFLETLVKRPRENMVKATKNKWWVWPKLILLGPMMDVNCTC